MGHALMDKVLIHWSNLPGNTYKVLNMMAKSGMDDDLIPTYFGGWERLAMTGLGRHNWPADDDDSPEATRVRDVAFEIVRRAISDAKKAGAIKVERSGKRGSAARYSLHLDSPNLWKTPVLPNETSGSYPTKRRGTPNKLLGSYPTKSRSTETKEKQVETRGEISSSPAVVSPERAAQISTTKLIRLQMVRDKADADLKARTS